MRKAMRDRVTDEFEFIEVPDDELYYKDPKRAMIEIDVEGSGFKRLCFVHRGHPTPTIPQGEFWTVSDVETGLAIASGKSAQDAIERATGKLQMKDQLERLVHSVASFMDEYGRANTVTEKPVIRDETVIFWHDRKKLKHAPVRSKRDYIASGGVACLITHHPTEVVNTEDVFYAWPEREDLCPSK